MKTEIINTITTSPQETEKCGIQIGNYIENNFSSFKNKNIFLALYGDVGAGKTVFVRGLCSILCPDDYVSSPTYTLVNEYQGKYKIVHYDMYRITDEDDLESTGFYDYENCIIAAEWCEKIEYALPDDYIKIEITKNSNENERVIKGERITK